MRGRHRDRGLRLDTKLQGLALDTELDWLLLLAAGDDRGLRLLSGDHRGCCDHRHHLGSVCLNHSIGHNTGIVAPTHLNTNIKLVTGPIRQKLLVIRSKSLL